MWELLAYTSSSCLSLFLIGQALPLAGFPPSVGRLPNSSFPPTQLPPHPTPCQSLVKGRPWIIADLHQSLPGFQHVSLASLDHVHWSLPTTLCKPVRIRNQLACWNWKDCLSCPITLSIVQCLNFPSTWKALSPFKIWSCCLWYDAFYSNAAYFKAQSWLLMLMMFSLLNKLMGRVPSCQFLSMDLLISNKR